MGKLFLFGDSITAGSSCTQGGWASRLVGDVISMNAQAEDIQSDFWCMPYNLGVIGNTIPDVLDRLKSEIEVRLDEGDVAQIVFAIGANDSVWLTQENRPRFTDAEFQNNLDRLISDARAITPHISFIGLTPADDIRVNPCPWAPQFGYTSERCAHFDSIIGQTCLRAGLPYLPVFQALRALPDYTCLLQDGVHPTTKGHAFLHGLISPFILSPTFLALHTEG